jgi:hypothetical protein
MMRRAAVVIVSLGLLVGLLPMASAQAAVPSARIVATAVTPNVDAGTGRAVFVASGLPGGTAYLQWFNPGKKAWQRMAKLKKAGSRGTVSITGLPQGVNRFRVQSGSSVSKSMYVRTYGVYTFDIFTKQHAFGADVMAARDYYLEETTLKVPDGFGCERIDLGLEIIQKDAPNWGAEIAAQSAVQPAPVVAINSTNQLVPTASVTNAAVGGPIDVVIRASASNGQPFFAWAGVQVHCLADPGI